MSLLSTSLLSTLYYEAKSHDIEYKADAFWQAYLNFVFPQSENYAVSCQWAPNSDDRHRVDIVVRQLEMTAQGGFMATLLFCETKRQGAHPRDAERQIESAAARYFGTNQQVSFVYGMTGWGVKARCWIMYRSSNEDEVARQPMFGDQKRGDKTNYIDAGSPDASVITHAIDTMKGNSQQDTQMYTASGSGQGSAWDVSYSAWGS